MRPGLALVGTALLLATPAAAATPARFAPCPRLGDAPRLPLRPGGRTLRGDVDGDGTRDRVAIHYARRARASCAFLLTLETARGVRAAVVPAYDQGSVESGYQHARAYPEPELGSLVRVRRRGLVVAVALGHGASTVQARLFWLARGRLVSSGRDVTAWGSIAENNQVDCYGGAGSGLIVETSESIANDAGTRWAFGRTVSRLTGRGLERVGATHVTVGTRKARVLARRWGLGYPPFRGCTVTGGL